MTVPVVEYGDAERIIVDHLAGLLDPDDCTVGVGVPHDWTPASLPHVQVQLDGTPSLVHPIVARATVRIVARAGTTTAAKRLADQAHGVLLGTPPPAGVASIQAMTGLLPARDPETRAELASFTVRVNLRGRVAD